jgi:hypothetical protein
VGASATSCQRKCMPSPLPSATNRVRVAIGCYCLKDVYPVLTRLRVHCEGCDICTTADRPHKSRWATHTKDCVCSQVRNTDFECAHSRFSHSCVAFSLSAPLMHSLRLAGVPPMPPSFKRHRFDSDPSRFSLNLSLSKPIPTPIWASLPSPPMSGSPPPDQLVDSLQRQGRRRKRSHSPDTSAPALASTPAVIAAPIFPSSSEASHHDVVATTAVSIQPATWPTSYPAPPSQIFVGGTSSASSSASLAFQPPFPVRSSSPKPTRKSKVHVPSACVNCKNKHLRCDNSRPCQRCVQSSKEVSGHLLFSLSTFFGRN